MSQILKSPLILTQGPERVSLSVILVLVTYLASREKYFSRETLLVYIYQVPRQGKMSSLDFFRN